MTSPVRILQIVMDIDRGSGVPNVVLNWHRHLNREKIQFDYLVCFSAPDKDSLREEIERLGGRVFYIQYRGLLHPFSFLHSVIRFFKEHSYKTVHSHVTSLGFFYYPVAKFYGVKTIIQHAHLTTWSDKKLNAARNYLLLHGVWPLIDYKLACSDAAGKAYYKKDYLVINNAIDLEKYRFKPDVRNQKRAELNVQDKLVVGHIGRFERQKNHFFLIDIFKEIIHIAPNAVLLLVGTGSRFEALQEYVSRQNLQDSVLFLGVRNDISDLLQAMDVFVLPSLFEGLPIVGVEAQAVGLPCIFSDTITKEVLLSKQAKALSLAQAPAKWAEQAVEAVSGQQPQNRMTKMPQFDIGAVVAKLEQFYGSLG